jgi:HPt (histidine-containing phosphotransfer) domain-containing protein
MSDPADIERIRRFADDMPGGLQDLVEQFIAHTAETVRDLRAAADAADVARVQLLAHRGAGTAGVFGAARLMELLRQAESQAKEKAMTQAAGSVAEVEVELARVHAFLRTLQQNEKNRT